MIAEWIAVFFACAWAATAAAAVILRKEWRRTRVLQQVALKINSTIKRKELLQNIMEVSAETLSAEGSSVILIDEKTGELYFEVATGERNEEVKEIRLQPGEGIAGWVARTGQPVLIADAAKDPRWSSKVSDKAGVPTRNLLCVPVASNGKVLGVLQVINKKGNKRFTKRDLGLLEMVASPAAAAIENMLLYETIRETTAARERMESELKIARDIQMSLLPGETMRTGRVELHAKLIPARQVGGDFYHFMRLDDGKLLVCLGDVSDKGIPAALFMSSLMIWIRSKAGMSQRPSEIIGAINREISTADSTMFATIFLAILDPETGRFAYCDGGHCTPLVVSREGVRELEGVKGLPVGIDPGETYEDGEAELQPGDMLVLYTDGITEAENAAGEWFTAARLRRALEDAGGLSPQEAVELIRLRVQDFAGDMQQSDDIAVMAVRFGMP